MRLREPHESQDEAHQRALAQLEQAAPEQVAFAMARALFQVVLDDVEAGRPHSPEDVECIRDWCATLDSCHVKRV